MSTFKHEHAFTFNPNICVKCYEIGYQEGQSSELISIVALAEQHVDRQCSAVDCVFCKVERGEEF